MQIFFNILVLAFFFSVFMAIACFSDSRKSDRRFKNGFKNNERDGRDPKLGLRWIGISVAFFVIIGMIHEFARK